MDENGYLDFNGLLRLVANMMTKFAVKEHKHVLSEITDSSNVVLCTEQTLTKEQQSQARANLGIVLKENGEVTSNEFTYSYDGDNTSDAHTWIYNTAGGKAFVKISGIPNGEIQLDGAVLNVVCPSNQWLNYAVTINNDMLSEVVDKGGVLIPAQVDGLTQIFYQHASDNSPISLLLVCTKPGTYDIAFDGWMEVLNIPQAGIYVMDNRTYGGNKYVQSFTCAVITEEEGSTESEPATPVNYKGSEISMFTRGICIGDSVTEGTFDGDDGGVVIKEYSYPSILHRLTNVDIVNAGVAGLTSKTWYEASLNSDSQWGKWLNNEWVWNMAPEASIGDTVSSQLNYSGYDFAFIHLGINDVGMMGDATVDEMIATFETNIGNIISKLKTSNDGIKVFLATILPSYATAWSSTYTALNDKIREIAENTADVYLVDLNVYSECASNPAYHQGHPTAVGYHKIASEIASYISYIISTNLDEFKMVQFIDKGDSWNDSNAGSSDFVTVEQMNQAIANAVAAAIGGAY